MKGRDPSVLRVELVLTLFSSVRAGLAALTGTPPHRPLLCTLAGGLVFLLATTTFAVDWVHWRGPERNGVSRETGLPASFEQTLWVRDDVSCRSTPIVMNGKVYAISKVGAGPKEQERVVCMDALTGDIVWEHRFSVFFTSIVSVRLGWTVLAGDPETGSIYAHGTQGLLFCLDAETGDVKWQKSLTEDFGRISGYGGRITSPLIDGDLLIVSMISSNWGSHGGGGCRFFAFDKRSGEVVWWNSTGFRPSNTYRCVPVATTINGERILISGGGDGRLHAFQVNTGKKVWSYEFGNGAMNPSPVVEGNLVWAAHGEENPGRATVGRLICLDVGTGQPELVWEKDGIEFKYPSPMLHEGKLYIPDRQGRLYCYDSKTGGRLWRRKFGRNCTGSPVYADNKIYLSSVHGYFHILDATAQGRVLARKRFQPANPAFDVEVQGSAAVANGCVYFGTTEEFYCLGSHRTARPEIPPQPAPPGTNPEGEPAQLLIVPADVTVRSGETVQFRARLFDSKGRFIRETEAQWSLAPMARGPGLGADAKLSELQGTLDDGRFVAPQMKGGQLGNVTATAAGLDARARVRQVPAFPYHEDFESISPGLIPPGWTNTQLRYVTTRLDGNTVLMKTARIAAPFYRQWYAFIGTPEMSGYSVSTDAMGEQVGNNLPNMGVTGHRYILQLVGNEQKLRLSAWDAIPRVSEEIPFTWRADKWYRLKLAVQIDGDAGLVRGKVWARDEDEPDDWTVELRDVNPNRSGAPGVYGSAQGIQPPKLGTRIYYDNVMVE